MDRGDSIVKPEPRSSPDTVMATQGHFPPQVTMWSAAQGPQRREAPSLVPSLGEMPSPPSLGSPPPPGPPQPLSLSALDSWVEVVITVPPVTS